MRCPSACMQGSPRARQHPAFLAHALSPPPVEAARPIGRCLDAVASLLPPKPPNPGLRRVTLWVSSTLEPARQARHLRLCRPQVVLPFYPFIPTQCAGDVGPSLPATHGTLPLRLRQRPASPRGASARSPLVGVPTGWLLACSASEHALKHQNSIRLLLCCTKMVMRVGDKGATNQRAAVNLKQQHP